jgi:hypothetical protein
MLNKKTFFKNHFLLNKGFQDLTLANDFKKNQLFVKNNDSPNNSLEEG